MKHRSLLKLMALAALLLVAGLAPVPRRSVQIRIGSKKFTESVILGEVLRLLVEQSDLEAAHYREFGGTRIVFDALVAGQIDAYPEYTGTIAAEIFAGQQVGGEEQMRELLAEQGVGMSPTLGFSNTYALAMTRRRAAELGVSRISDLKRLPEAKLALTHEFLDRGDGWPALQRHYDLPQTSIPGVDHDLSYRQLLAGELDVIDVYSTDAMIRRGDLLVLADDQAFFPRYDAVWLYRLAAAERYPGFKTALDRVVGHVSEPIMQQLNDDVEAGRLSESQAAASFITETLKLPITVKSPSLTETISRHVLEHLDLVRRSLLPAIVVGVALGVWCQRQKRTGSLVLTAVALLQTIPSLALLVLLLPVVAALGYQSIGEGSVTAVVALFGYCLLPIVRNTYTGLDGIPRGTIESATVLGLDATSRLVEVELPIALPTILAGIRTAAVQNVGFATLGAIIGAGGLGQPILRGIRVNDISLILAGAIPAAALALLLQWAIDLLERAVVPRGLKRLPPARD